jgi:hypothetical protein
MSTVFASALHADGQKLDQGEAELVLARPAEYSITLGHQPMIVVVSPPTQRALKWRAPLSLERWDRATRSASGEPAALP